ncbi:hypothetical protein [Paraburkholderia sp. C35]|uniref:hypothetical protein n=1 Tax=Paraburkholderia sp. C35 TaxID=2126993 RepID=UPI001EF50F5D|nr:hypothetical protein [Paraburkholderia sp. C35]
MLTSMKERKAWHGQPHECSRQPGAPVTRKRIPDESFDTLAYDRDLVERMGTSLY